MQCLAFCVAGVSSADIRSRHLRNEPRHEFDRRYLDRLAAGDPEIESHFNRYFRELLVIKLRSRLRSSALVEEIPFRRHRLECLLMRHGLLEA